MTDDQERLRGALLRVAVALKQADVPFALAGGYAGWALGGPEPEHDVDLVVARDQTERAEAVLRDAGLRVEQPSEDWLFKAYDGDAMVDVIYAMNGQSVDDHLLGRAVELSVLSVTMPVLCATDVVVTKVLALDEHACDFGKVLPTARALREQVDWQEVRDAAAGNPFAEAFLVLADKLDLSRGSASASTAASAPGS